MTPFSFFAVLAGNVCSCIHVGLGHRAVFKEVWSLFSPVTLHFPPGRNIFVFSGLVAFKNVSVLKMEFGETPVFKLKRIAVKAYVCLSTLYWSTGFSSVSGGQVLSRFLLCRECSTSGSEVNTVWPRCCPLPSR